MKKWIYPLLCTTLAACSTATPSSALSEMQTTRLGESDCVHKQPNYCYEVNTAYLTLGKPWLDKVLHQTFAIGLSGLSADSAVKSGEAAGNTPEQAFRQTVGHMGDSLKELDVDRDVTYTLSFTQDVKGQRGNVLTIENVGEYDFGGAHPYYETRYLNADVARNKILSMDDIVVAGSEEKLAEKLQSIYWQGEYFKDFSAEDKKSFAETWMETFSASLKHPDNFYFGSKGIVFSFAPYSIGPWAMGQVELELPYAEAKGLIRDEYLQ